MSFLGRIWLGRKGLQIKILLTSFGRNPNSWCLGIALILVLLTLFQTSLAHTSHIIAVRNDIVVSVTSSDLLASRSDFRGQLSAKYTLVEFGDHECPPCRHTELELDELMKSNASVVKLDFREFPLTNIHAHAEDAAIAAESARTYGKFWAVHKQLFVVDLSQKDAIRRILLASGSRLCPAVAKTQIAHDKALADRLNVRATPTFFLCCPNGTVLRLKALDDLPLAIQ